MKSMTWMKEQAPVIYATNRCVREHSRGSTDFVSRYSIGKMERTVFKVSCHSVFIRDSRALSMAR